jgi:transposase
MIPFRGGTRVWIALGQTDMRRGMDALARQVQHGLQREELGGVDKLAHPQSD